MSKTLQERLARVEKSRANLLAQLADVDESKGSFRPSETSWSIQQIVEHLALAEEVGTLFIWRALVTPWEGEHPHRGMSIEAVVQSTWKEKEIAPEPATPRFGGPLAYWSERLRGCAQTLEALGQKLVGKDLDAIIYPHVLSGPLDAGQRIDFLAFHMDRHREQLLAVKQHERYPGS